MGITKGSLGWKMKDHKQKRRLIYLGSSQKDADKLPLDVKDVFVEALRMALIGETHEDAKIFRHHGSGVFEVVADHRSSTFREIYLARYSEVIFVIHIFQKKSTKGMATPKPDMEVIEKRLKWAHQIYQEEYGKSRKKGK
jgi:phage-related protein